MSRLLDTPRGHLYKSRPVWAAVMLWAGIAGAEVVDGVHLPSGATQVGENRYRAPGDLESILKHYRTVYPVSQFPRKSIVNMPGVKAIHITNPSRRKFEGLNIYEANQEVRIFILRSEEKPSKKRSN